MQGTYTTKIISALLYPLLGRGNQQSMIVSMRGRNPDNPKSRSKCDHLEQILEPNAQGICGALTSVQKDNLVLEEKEKPIVFDIIPVQNVKKCFLKSANRGIIQ